MGESIRFGGKFYQFKSLVPLYGSAFVFSLLIHFTEAFHSNASSGNSKRLQGLRSFFETVARSALKDPKGTATRVHQQLSDGVSPSAGDMKELAAEYGDIIRDFSDMLILGSKNNLSRHASGERVSGPSKPSPLWDVALDPAHKRWLGLSAQACGLDKWIAAG